MEKQITKLKFFIYLLSIILIVQIAGSVLFFRNANFLYNSSFKNINSLIGEVGQLKDQNRLLDNKIDFQKEIISLNEQALTNIFQQIDEKLGSDEDLKVNVESLKTELLTAKTRFTEENIKLGNLLDEKKAEIENAKTEKQITEEQNAVNDKITSVLFLGDNQKLTDSIILVVVNPEHSKITMISIPRDLYINGRKINEYYEYFGIEKINEVIFEVSGIKVDKYVEFNFGAFTAIIDYLGGINVQIDEKLVDKSYPAPNFGYKTVTFEPGIESMNGERALEYARSRKSTSDFDRSLRQQKVVLSVKNKLDSVDVMKNPDFYLKAFQIAEKNIETNLNIFEAIQLYESYKKYNLFAGNILSNENFLYSSKSATGQSILLPKGGNFQKFQEKVLQII